jgi:hypothetical protein
LWWFGGWKKVVRVVEMVCYGGERRWLEVVEVVSRERKKRGKGKKVFVIFLWNFFVGK